MAKAKAKLPKVKTGRQYATEAVANRFARQEADGDSIPFTYSPTKTTWPANGWDHRRTTDGGYDRTRGRLRVKFYTDGSEYDYGTYMPVPPEVARAFRRAQSPGIFINDVLSNYGYERVN